MTQTERLGVVLDFVFRFALLSIPVVALFTMEIQFSTEKRSRESEEHELGGQGVAPVVKHPKIGHDGLVPSTSFTSPGSGFSQHVFSSLPVPVHQALHRQLPVVLDGNAQDPISAEHVPKGEPCITQYFR